MLVDFYDQKIKKKDGEEILSIAINLQDEGLSLKYAIHEFINQYHIKAGKKHVLQSDYIEKADRIYRNLLKNADIKVLNSVLDEAKSPTLVDGMAKDINDEIDQRKLTQAIKTGDMNGVNSCVKPPIVNPLINKDHLDLAAEKYRKEVLINRKSDETKIASKILRTLIKGSKTSLLDDAKKTISLRSARVLIEKELTNRKVKRKSVLEQIQDGSYKHAYTPGLNRRNSIVDSDSARAPSR